MEHQTRSRWRVRIIIAVVFGLLLQACGAIGEGVSRQPTAQPVTMSVSESLSPARSTVTPSASATREPSQTATITPTRLPTITPSASPSPDVRLLSQLPGDPLILFTSETHTQFYFLNIVTGESWELNYPPPMGGYDFMAWSRDGCEIILGPYHSVGTNVIRMDLRGNVIEELFSFEDLLASVSGAALTLSEDMLAYSGTGRFVTEEAGSYHFRGTFLDVVDLAHGSGIRRLSETLAPIHEMLAWSPDGEWLAYTEPDPDQVIQVVISRPDGSERRQLTQFTDSDPSVELRELRWSPDSTGLAFFYSPAHPWDDPPETFLAVVPEISSGMPARFVDLPRRSFNRDFWWQGNSTVVLPVSGSLMWVDVTNDQVIDTLEAPDGPEGYVQWVRPIEGSTLIVFLSPDIYLYDPTTRTLSKMPNGRLLFEQEYIVAEDWAITPASFPGEENCAP